MLRVRTVMTGVAGSPYYSNLYFGGTTLGEAFAAVEAVDNFWIANQALICTPLVWDIEPDVAQIDPATGQIIAMHATAGDNGLFAGSGEAAPTSSQLLCRFFTGQYRNGRQVRGRMYMPYLVITIIDDGRVLASAAALVVGRLNDLLTEASAAGGLVVYSRTHGEEFPVTAASVWNELAVQRSRRD